MSALHRALRYLSTAAALVAGLTAVALMLLIGYSVFMRYVLSSPVRGTEEIGSLLVMLIVFLPLAYTFESDGHIRTDVLLQRAGTVTRRVLETLAGVAAIVWSLVVCLAVSQRTWRFYESGTTSHGGAVELWIPSLAMVVGTVLLVLQTLVWTVMRGFESAPETDDAVDVSGPSGI